MVIRLILFFLQDFDNKETTSTFFLPTALDPGRKSIFQTTIVSENGYNQFGKCATKEYYNFTRPTKMQAELSRKKESKPE